MTSPHQPQPARQPPVDFDDRLWPVNLALVVLAGFIAGVIAAKSDFETQQLVYNGYLHLGVLAAIVGVLMWGVSSLGRRVQRRLQLGVFVSLLVHFWLCMLSYNVYLSVAARDEPDAAEQFKEPQLVTLPDYHWQDQRQDVLTDEAIEAPVETELPEAESRPLEQTRPEPTPIDRPSEAEPSARQREPNRVELERAEMTPPHRAERLSGERISRSEPENPAPPEQPVETPQIGPSSEQPAAMEDDVAAIERQATAADVERPASQPIAPSAPNTPERARLQRRTAADRPAPNVAAAQPARRMASAPTASVARVDAPAQPSAAATQPSRIEASSNAAVERAAPNAPRGRVAAASAPVAQTPPDITPSLAARRSSGGGRPTLGEARDSAQVPKAATTVEPSDAATVASDGAAGQAQPSSAADSLPDDLEMPDIGTLARGDRTLPGARPMSGVPRSSGPGNPGVSSSTMGELRRAETQSTPSLGASRPAGNALARSQAAAAASGDVEAVELPAGAADAARSSTSGAGGSPGPRVGDASRQAASLPANSLPLAAGSPGGNGASEPAAARLAAPSAGGPTAPRRGDRIDGAAASLAGASGGVMPRGASPDDAAVGGDATIDLAEIASPSDGAAESAAGPATADALAGRGDLAVGRMASAGLPVRIAAPAGPGGLASQRSAEIGLPSRRARPESEVVHTAAGRIIVERSGGKLADVRVRDTAVPGLRQRDRATRRELARQRGGSESSERAVEMGLDFLARHQNPDGSWSLHDFSQGQPGYENAGFGRMQSDTAATGLSMLAFLGAGYTHTDGKYRLVVGRGLSYLVGNQREEGDLFVPQDAKSNLNVWLYSHGIAAIALCEAYGMTRDPTLHDPAQRALDFIVAAQSPTEGGWRYAPRLGSDTSVSGWQLMALKSGELAGLNAPAETYRRVEIWLDGAQARENSALYAYRPKAKQNHQRLASRVMTAEGLLMRQYLGWKRDNPNMQAGADYLLGHLPQWDGAGQRDAYYWYYATQVMFQIGGEHWRQWNDRLRELLIDRQTPDGALAGSWDPLGPAPDRWGREAGRLYTTAMHLLMLEVYYRHLPLYRNLEGEE